MATLVEGDTKALFSIATTPRCRGRRYSISRIAPLYPWSSLYSAECKARRHQVPFLSLWYNSTCRLKPGLLNHWRYIYCTIYLIKRKGESTISHSWVWQHRILCPNQGRSNFDSPLPSATDFYKSDFQTVS